MGSHTSHYPPTPRTHTICISLSVSKVSLCREIIAGFNILIFQSQPPKCRDYRHRSSRPLHLCSLSSPRTPMVTHAIVDLFLLRTLTNTETGIIKHNSATPSCDGGRGLTKAWRRQTICPLSCRVTTPPPSWLWRGTGPERAHASRSSAL